VVWGLRFAALISAADESEIWLRFVALISALDGNGRGLRFVALISAAGGNTGICSLRSHIH